MSTRSSMLGNGRAYGRLQTALLIAGVVAAAALIVVAAFAPSLTVDGWLIGFVFVSAVPLGSLALLMIHRLTGGHWGDGIRPMAEPASAVIPLLALLFIPTLLALPSLYPWAGGGGHVSPSVAHDYLNQPLFIARAVVSFAGWSGLALLLPRLAGRSGMLSAALGLIFYAVTISLTSIDWILSSEPVFISTSFGASIAFMQLQAALAFAALTAPTEMDEQARRDLGGLMLAVTLGLTYINFMAVLVMWYGNIPDKVDWFVIRAFPPWKWLATGAFILASPIPILSLLLSRLRANRSALRLNGVSILCGQALFDAWLLAPVYGAWSLATAALATVALSCCLLAAVSAGCPAALFKRVGVVHD